MPENDTWMRIHRRQFVIAPKPVAVVPNWVTVEIPHVGFLYHCPELRVASTTDAQGNMWYLLGFAVQTDPDKPNPIDQIATATPDTIHDTYQSWAGRWVLIGDGKLYMDAAGLLGCFYSLKQTAGGTQELWISSSAALLVDLLNIDATPVRSIAHAVGIDWYTPPQSRFKSIRRLLPSQILDLTSGALLARRLMPQPSENLSYEAVLDRAQTILVNALRQAARLSDTLWLPLTAGYDSRLLLATACYAGVPVKTYTHGNKYMHDADFTIPPKLAAAAGVEYALHAGGPFSKDRAAAYDRHTAGHCVDRDRYFISHGYFNWCRKGDRILHGGCFELGRCYFWDRFPGPGVVSTLPDAQHIVAGFRDMFNPSLVQGANPALLQAIEEWTNWASCTPNEELDWRDRCYWEQRLAGWLSSVLQSLDLIDAECFNAANSHVYFAHVLKVPEAKRYTSQHQVDLIKRMAPELLAFPFNPPDARYKRMLRKIRRANEYVQARLHW